MHAEESVRARLQAHAVRDDYIPKTDYTSREFAALEKERLWPRVWQVACRVEELANPGDYLTYDIADDSFIVTRTAEGEIRAFHNVCLHRGRRLATGCGNTKLFTCRYHGWRWKTDGSLHSVVDRGDFAECWGMKDSELSLGEVKVGLWGGFVFVNADPKAAPLSEFLQPVPEYFDFIEMEKMRFAWHKTMVANCNYKVAQEAFQEGYHTAQAHPQLLPYQDDQFLGYARGLHGNFDWSRSRPLGSPAGRTGLPVPSDLRPLAVKLLTETSKTVWSIFSERDRNAIQRLMTEAPQDATPAAIFEKLQQFMREAAEASGAGWPKGITPQKVAALGTDWSIFPNITLVPTPGCVLGYRARPYGDDPDWSLFESFSLERFAPGAEPPLRKEFYEDWTQHRDAFPPVLLQDFENFADIQRGLKSHGFRGSRINPVQEKQIANIHRSLHTYLFGKQETRVEADSGTERDRRRGERMPA